MDASTRRKINGIINELSSIKSELNNISSGIVRDCHGVGEYDCSNAIDEVASDCGSAISKLYHL